MLTVAELMNEVMKAEKEYNHEVYKGKVKYIRIHHRLFSELLKDPKNGHKIMFVDGSPEISGIGLVPTGDIEKWELIYKDK